MKALCRHALAYPDLPMTSVALPMPSANALRELRRGAVIPAHPLALNARRGLDERRQRALTRYYLHAGAGGLAVAVHSTQFAIRESQHALLTPVLALAAEEISSFEKAQQRTIIKVAGVCGRTHQAICEAELAMALRYDMCILSLDAMPSASEDELISHCLQVSRVAPLVGFYLQPSVGGRVLPVSFWRRFAEISNVVAIKIAPFNRYQTIDVVRAVAETGRALAVATVKDSQQNDAGPDHSSSNDGIALYTGNDDNIVGDLLSDWVFSVGGRAIRQRIVGGLLGHWACWTRKAVDVLTKCRRCNESTDSSRTSFHELNVLNRQITDMNAAVFDAANDFEGCIPGVHEVLRRQGLLEGTWCLDPRLALSPGQADEITRVTMAYPHLTDDEFVAGHLDHWLK